MGLCQVHSSIGSSGLQMLCCLGIGDALLDLPQEVSSASPHAATLIQVGSFIARSSSTSRLFNRDRHLLVGKQLLERLLMNARSVRLRSDAMVPRVLTLLRGCLRPLWHYENGGTDCNEDAPLLQDVGIPQTVGRSLCSNKGR